MGMSASQARLLCLTTQLNNLSLKGQFVSDAKTRLAMDTQEVQNKYINALNSSRLYMNTNIFSENGTASKAEYISLANLQSAGFMVSDGSKILGYNFEDVDTGEVELIPTGEYEDDLTQPIYPQNPQKTNYFSSARPSADGDIDAMTNIIYQLGLDTNNIELQSYIMKDDNGGKGTYLNAIVIKSQEAFDSVFQLLLDESKDGNLDNALKQNFVIDMEEVDLSNFKNTILSGFSGVFDINGTLVKNYDESQALFNDGIAKHALYEPPEPIGYKKKPVYIEHAVIEHKLVEDAGFNISSLALEEGLRSGALTLVQKTTSTDSQSINLNGIFFNTINLSTCPMITDETDTEAANKAEAEYNRDMNELQMKDKQYDMDQKKIDTQYQAYTAEEESIKNVLKKNVQNSFKTFG